MNNSFFTGQANFEKGQHEGIRRSQRQADFFIVGSKNGTPTNNLTIG
jgi:hypothetical protein